MSKYDLVLYDLDGTLQDSVPLIMESLRTCYDIVLGGTDRTDEDLMSYIGKPLTDTFRMHDEETQERLIRAYLDYNCARMKENVIPIFPGVYDFLAKIRALGVKQGIVTSKLEESAMITIDLLELGQYFDDMVFREATERAKPYGDPLVEASALWALMDQNTRRVVFPELYGIKIRGVHTGKELALPASPRMPQGEQTGSFTVPYSYVDLNGHMNNTRYFDLAEDLMPPELRARRITGIQTEYAKEAREGDTILLRQETAPDAFLLCGEQNGQKLFRLALTYGD